MSRRSRSAAPVREPAVFLQSPGVVRVHPHKIDLSAHARAASIEEHTVAVQQAINSSADGTFCVFVDGEHCAPSLVDHAGFLRDLHANGSLQAFLPQLRSISIENPNATTKIMHQIGRFLGSAACDKVVLLSGGVLGVA
jgi:hypothetical protein